MKEQESNSNSVTKESVGEEPKRKSTRRWFRFSIRTILVFMTIMTIVAVIIGLWTAEASREIRARADFTDPKVKGSIKELKPRWIARYTPSFLQEWIGKEYFETTKSVFVYVYMSPDKAQKYHPERSLKLLGESLGHLRNLDYLDLRFSGDLPHDPIDLTSLSNCVGIGQLELSGASSEIVSDVVSNTTIRCLCLNNCTVDSEMISSTIKNETITTLQFNFATINGEQLKRLSKMKNLNSIHFFQCEPTISEDALTLNLKVKPMSGSFKGSHSRISANESELIKTWFEREIPGVSISGLEAALPLPFDL